MTIVLILICVFVIVGLTYTGVSAWLRDRERNAEHRRRRGGGTDLD
ncbi:MAG: hypothetical protein QOE31_471 [Solirubrobacteraceae bacterium]|jgi:hypothetical protein|nr:hypothetical protein [Solirubrobacteraceae bacterium]